MLHSMARFKYSFSRAQFAWRGPFAYIYNLSILHNMISPESQVKRIVALTAPKLESLELGSTGVCTSRSQRRRGKAAGRVRNCVNNIMGATFPHTPSLGLYVSPVLCVHVT